ncbi:hypothetical protein [Bradyrhizobium erythrophlei]|jgi:hypothetical protein|uniref:Uncharacterized protein n=1 Tax=Bradyrhizobium erythrophlei TaxID=1437360 RepID=A0A1M7ULR0_9BRAD|nr:hypothetical protein [Bradyrhizobium erythrophlei]SHN83827.1 hypothetical protein SAMN05444170_5663 [Bradyrhizobium erythrophlei]
MNSETKQDCIESIVRVLERTALWRKSIAANYNDNRNIRAAQTLDKLAVDAAKMTDDDFMLLKDHFDWNSMVWRNAVNQATRQIGFFNRSSNFGAFVRALVHELSLSSRVAA